MKLTILTSCVIPLLFFSVEMNSQEAFQKFYGTSNYEEGNCVIKLADNNLLLACAQGTSQFSGRDILLIKMDKFGNEIWSKTCVTSADEVPRAVIQTADSGFAIVGSIYGGSSANNEQIFLIKTDQTGSVIWSKYYGGFDDERGFTVQQTDDGGFILGGSIESNSNGQIDAYFIKTDEFGTVEWSRSMGGVSTDNNFDIHQTSDGGYIFTGSQGSYGTGPFDYWLVKLTASGDLDWAKAYGGSAEEHSRIVHEANDGGYIIMGHTTTWGAGNWDILMIKTDENGNEQWSKVYGGPSLDFAGDFTATGDGYCIASFSESYGLGRDFLLMKIDNSGNLQWAKNYGFSGNDELPFGSQSSILQYDSETFFLIGKASVGQLGGADIFLQKMNAQGESGCNFEMVSPNVFTPNVITLDVNIPVNNNGSSQQGNFQTGEFSPMVDDYCLPPIADFMASDTIICVGECIDFTDNSINDPISFSWIFEGGFPASSSALNPQNICYETSGVFQVQLIISNQVGSDTAYQFVEIHDAPEIDLGADTTLCVGQSLTLSVDDPNVTMISWSTGSSMNSIVVTDPGIYSVTAQNTECSTSDQIIVDFEQPVVDLGNDFSFCEGESVVLNAFQNGASYLWQDGSVEPTFETNSEGWYSVAVFIGDCSDVDSIYLTSLPSPSVELGPDTIICPGTALILDAYNSDATYLWNDGSTASTLEADQAGFYSVEVALLDCVDFDMIEIEMFPEIEVSILEMDTTLCLGFETTLNASAEHADSLMWSNDMEGTSIQVTESGTYFVTASNGCETVISNSVDISFEDCNCHFEVPNVFTPNFDGINDYFLPVTDCEVLAYNLKIFGRWGAFMFESKEFSEGWDGVYKSKDAASEVYVYLIEATIMRNGLLETIELAGDVTLIR